MIQYLCDSDYQNEVDEFTECFFFTGIEAIDMIEVIHLLQSIIPKTMNIPITMVVTACSISETDEYPASVNKSAYMEMGNSHPYTLIIFTTVHRL